MSADEYVRLMLIALDEWTGTPEELGACLAQATSPMPTLPWPGASDEQFVIAERSRIFDARARLHSTPDCSRLLRYALKHA